jgi:hypothetical protein
MKNTAISEISKSVVGYGSVMPEHQQVHIIPEHVHYAFLPVWMLSTQWNGQNYIFAMNGQTGKMVGDLPVDNKKFILYFIAIAVVVAAAVYIIAGMLL